MQLQCGLCKEASCVQPRVPVSGHHHLLLTVTLRKRPSAEEFCGSKPRPRDSGPPLDPATAAGARLSRFLAARLIRSPLLSMPVSRGSSLHSASRVVHDPTGTPSFTAPERTDRKSVV